jgi:hypothetical protein
LGAVSDGRAVQRLGRKKSVIDAMSTHLDSTSFGRIDILSIPKSCCLSGVRPYTRKIRPGEAL